MSRICFICMDNTMFGPYIEKYLELCGNNEVNAIVWNRHNQQEIKFDRVFLFNANFPHNGMARKVYAYIRFFLYARKILRREHYDRLVFTTANASILLFHTLRKVYYGKYLVDIRDYFMERNRLYYALEKKVIEGSGLSIISSAAYVKFLPEHNYLIWHNLSFINCNTTKNIHKDPIVLSYVGSVRFVEMDFCILNTFKNDARFLVEYIGLGTEKLENYCRIHNIKNVYFEGEFSPDKIVYKYKRTDFVLNLYGNGTPLLDYALSNKLYHAASLSLPILVCKDTYMCEISCRYGFGLSIDILNENIKEEILQFYSQYDRDRLRKGCKAFIEEAKRTNENTYLTIHDFLTK